MLTYTALGKIFINPFFITDKTCMRDDTKTNKQANKNKALYSFFRLLSIPGMLMKMKTRQPSLFLIELNKAIVNHIYSLTFLFIFFLIFSPSSQSLSTLILGNSRRKINVS